MPDHSDLNPQRLKPGLAKGSLLKLGLVTPLYTSGTPSAAGQIKPSLRDKAGNLKSGLVSGSDLKPSLLNGNAVVPWSPADIALNQWFLDGGNAYEAARLGNAWPLRSLESYGTYRQPRAGRCGLFDGIDDYASTGITLHGATEFTIWRRAKYLSDSTYNLDGFFDTSTIRLGRNNTNVFWNPGYSIGSDSATVANGVWHTLAMTNKSGGTAMLYKDGIEIASVASMLSSISSSLSYWIGADNVDGASSIQNSNFKVSDYRIYNRQLSASEIEWLESGGLTGSDPTNANLLAQWTFSEEAGTVGYDISGNGNHLTLTNITPSTFHAADTGVESNANNQSGYRLSGGVYIPKRLGSALAADGNALTATGKAPQPAMVETPCVTGDGSTVNVDLGIEAIPKSGDFELEFVVKPIGGSYSAFAGLLGQTNGSAWTSGFGVFWDSGASSWRVFFGSYLTNIISVALITDQWNTLLIRKVGTVLYVAVNGEAETSTSCTATIASTTTTQMMMFVGSARTACAIARLSISNGKTFPMQDGPGSSNNNRNLAWYDASGGGVAANAIINGTVATIWGTRCPSFAKDHCAEYGGRIGAAGQFILGVPGSANCADGNAKTLAAGKHGNPFSRVVPNAWDSPELRRIGYTPAIKLAPTDAVQATSPADTKFRRSQTDGDDRYFSTDAALTGTDKSNAESYVA